MGEELSTTSCPVLTEALLCIMKASLWTVVWDTVIKMGSITTTPIFCAMRPELQLERMIPINVCWLDGPEMVFQSMGIVRTPPGLSLPLATLCLPLLPRPRSQLLPLTLNLLKISAHMSMIRMHLILAHAIWMKG